MASPFKVWSLSGCGSGSLSAPTRNHDVEQGVEQHDVEQGVEQSSTRRTSLDVDGVGQSRPSFSRDVREESARDLIF